MNNNLKPVVERFVKNLFCDLFPQTAAEIIDFGFNNVDEESQSELFRLYQAGLLMGKFSIVELNDAVGDGPMLTALVQRCGYEGRVKTDYDDMMTE